MQISMPLNYSGDIKKTVDLVVELEKVGLDTVWVAELYGFDAVSLMGYLAARTERVQIGSAILPLYSRTPTLIAQTAAGLDYLSGGRAVLGLGRSEEHTSELQSRENLVCRLLLEKKKDSPRARVPR